MRTLLFTLFFLAAGWAHAQKASPTTTGTPHQEVMLWPDGAPGAKGYEAKDQPNLTVFLPPADRATGAAVVVCPGGGYHHLAMEKEGFHVAEWLNSLGVAAFVLKYRLGSDEAGGYRHPAMLQDAQRAIRTVRRRAKEYSIDPKRVGIMGFSAGGHLAATAGTHYDAGNADAKDRIERLSSRPDFMVLIYPVITLEQSFTHAGSRHYLLGDHPEASLVHSLSNETQVDSLTPPAFLVHANDDQSVPPQNSVYFYLALKEAGVSAELHLYDHGGHGFGMADGASYSTGQTLNDPMLHSWTRRCADWLQHQGWLGEKKSQPK
ncbi:Acetyl esterase/lipase [Catalinimonas alkaloidigena]|uniref:Acetyl esterase/lipase n=1 Tax=Catalinimonas alkaloidigena TaxID=1075417 RepID=A0A1G9K1S5_9BACT|nr:alpha/beta hydrolase [Catalinimonas alkaloidigena]SDL43416.1 Acetyl esterase/lipase [Catalinimonas alkaloidigena]